jgi:hypothetical protein
MNQIIVDEGGTALQDLARSISDELGHLVSGGEVIIEARPQAFRMPQPSIDLRVAEGGLETAVSRQGHGFQRALLIAVVQQLAAVRPTARDGAPVAQEPAALFLAIEEPELYQHPQQARHFATSLAELATTGSIQVAYATHSEHFIDPARFERLRRFRRRSGTPWPIGEVTRATLAGVAGRLVDVVDRDEVETRVRITLRRQLAEAVFARAVLVVEGHSDAGFLHGIADRSGGLDALGIAVVAGMGKTNLLIPWAILEELAIPTFVVFDGDAALAERLRAQGKLGQATKAEVDVPRENRKLLSGLGVAPQDHPPTVVGVHYSVFHDNLESEAESWAGYADKRDFYQEELGDRRGKSEDVYRLAAGSTAAEPPSVFTSIIRALSGRA